jgi:hypothetical protein
MMERPETRFARSGDVMIAYQVTGEEHPVDLVLAPGVVSHLDMDWESPEDIRNSLPSAVRRMVGDRSRGAAGGRVRRPADEADSGKAELVGNVKQEMVRLRAGIEELERELGTGDG